MNGQQFNKEFWAKHDPYNNKQLKRCCRCRRIQERVCFSRSEARKDGLSPTCKKCVAIDSKRIQKNHLEHWINSDPYIQEKSKPCSNCDEILSIKMFARKSTERSGIRSQCRSCTNAKEREWYRARIRHTILSRAKKRAKKLNLEFNIKEEDIVIPPICPVLGIPLKLANGIANYNSPSLDRIDNNKGYIKENICVISHRANTIKNNATALELRLIANYAENNNAASKEDQIAWAKEILKLYT